MKMVAIGIVVAAGLGVAMANHADSEQLRRHQYPADCIISAAIAPGYLPRAGLMVENRLDRAVRVSLEARVGAGLGRTDFGTIGAREQRTFAHALPAGRNVLTADNGSSRVQRQVIYVSNHGPGTCSRRFLYRIS